jgi:hypothetical protein
MAPMTLGECYICYPDIVIQHIDRLPNKDRLVLIEDLNFGFREAIYQEEDNIKNIKLLTDKLDTWIKKAKL